MAPNGSVLPPSVEVPSSQPSSVEKLVRAPAPRIEPKPGETLSRQDVISHFPLEHDPDDSGMIVPGPPRVPVSTGPQTPNAPFAASSPRPISRAPQPQSVPSSAPHAAPPLAQWDAHRSGHSAERELRPGAAARGAQLRLAHGDPSGQPSSLPARPALHTAAFDAEGGAAAARVTAQRGALAALVDRVSELVDLRASTAARRPTTP